MILFYIQLCLSVFLLVFSGVWLGSIFVTLTLVAEAITWQPFAWFLSLLALGVYLLYNCIMFLMDKSQ